MDHELQIVPSTIFVPQEHPHFKSKMPIFNYLIFLGRAVSLRNKEQNISMKIL